MANSSGFKPWKDFWLEYFTENTQSLSIIIGLPPIAEIDNKYTHKETDTPVTRDRYYRELEKVLIARPGKWDNFLEGEEMAYTHTEDGKSYHVAFNNGYRAMAKITRMLDSPLP